MLIQDVMSSGSMPVLEKALQFEAQRHKVITNNIANMETPDYRPMDVSVKNFQKMLAKAVEKRQQATGGQNGALELEETREVTLDSAGGLHLHPRTASGNVLYHDRNNRDLERMMQDLAENTLAYRTTADFMRREHEILRTAISQRV